MTYSKRRSLLSIAAVAVFALTLPSCGWMNTVGGREIQVVFRNAGDLQTGAAAYVSGVEVGVSRDPQVVNGRAVVPVQLYRQQKNAVAAGTVFLIMSDPKRVGKNCLAGYGAGLSPDPSKPDELFFGASNRLELVGLIGLQKVTDLIDKLKK